MTKSIGHRIAASGLTAAPLLGLGLLLTVSSAKSTAAEAGTCPGGNPGITLSPGFCATVFADNLGHVRHMTFGPNGVLYVNTWTGRYFRNVPPPPGGLLVALKDSKGTGKADVIAHFGDSMADGSGGGSGIAYYKDAIYAEENDKIVRFALPAGEITPKGKAEVIVSGLPLTGDHPMHPFIIDASGNLFVDLGSATNACQADNRMANSPGITPCTELETRGGTWRFDANKKDQQFSAKERYATGIRNGEGFSIDSTGRMFATQHGRDQLSQNWPKLYKTEQSAELPAEELIQLQEGGDYGWPECYYDGLQKKLVLAPEYGGNGKDVGICAQKLGPVAFFPAHWAPNDLLIYTGEAFPAPFHDGAFVAFHGSWNRAPAPQGGYNVVFQPMKDGKASGDFVIFADGFAGKIKDPGRAAYRPTGLAMGPDGALYISDDVKGRIWRVTYKGSADATKLESAPASTAAAANGSSDAVPPEGTHPDAGRAATAALPVPKGTTKDQVALGERIFHGEVSDGTCTGCHGSDAKGSPQAPDLTSGIFVQSDGSLEALIKTISAGVPKPRNYSDPMPPKGGAPLSDSDVTAVAAYVWAISHSDEK